jgi:hypothetical protein
MAAGLGFKEFTTGDVLTAADANGYLASQVVMVFASAAARTSAIASPQEGMISYLKDTNSTEYYSGSAWVAIGGASASGLTLITSQAFTTSTAINVNSVFSATYTNYKVIIRTTATTAGGDSTVTMRLRVSGTDSTTTYLQQRSFSFGTTTGADQNTAWTPLEYNPTYPVQMGEIELYGPAVASITYGLGSLPKLNNAGTPVNISASFYHTTATAYDGFSLIPSSGNITGTVEVYGYAK